MKKLGKVMLGVVLFATTMYDGTETKKIEPKVIKSPVIYEDVKDWSIELSSGTSFSNVRTDNKQYTLVPINLTVSYKLDDVSLNDWRRGYTEFFGTGYHTFVTSGPESRISGFNFGPRYNFVQDGWKFVPYIESNVGLAYSDSTPYNRGLGQDFCFEFGVGAGVKYLLTDSIYIRLGCDYIHYSNAGLSEPNNKNNPIDGIGFKTGIGANF